MNQYTHVKQYFSQKDGNEISRETYINIKDPFGNTTFSDSFCNKNFKFQLS